MLFANFGLFLAHRASTASWMFVCVLVTWISYEPVELPLGRQTHEGATNHVWMDGCHVMSAADPLMLGTYARCICHYFVAFLYLFVFRECSSVTARRVAY